MLELYQLIFLLFAAVLIYGWYYWQRAQRRAGVKPHTEDTAAHAHSTHEAHADADAQPEVRP
jgi:nicotinamide riboside transporter PnuC